MLFSTWKKKNRSITFSCFHFCFCATRSLCIHTHKIFCCEFVEINTYRFGEFCLFFGWSDVNIFRSLSYRFSLDIYKRDSRVFPTFLNLYGFPTWPTMHISYLYVSITLTCVAHARMNARIIRNTNSEPFFRFWQINVTRQKWHTKKWAKRSTTTTNIETNKFGLSVIRFERMNTTMGRKARTRRRVYLPMWWGWVHPETQGIHEWLNRMVYGSVFCILILLLCCNNW